MREFDKIPIKILLVDDDGDYAKAVTDYLNGKVESVSVASGADEGVELFRKARPDLVVTDIRLVGGGEASLVRRIKRLDPQTPVFITATFGETIRLTEAIREGVNHYIYKETDPSKLLETIRDYFNLLRNDFLTLDFDEEERILEISEIFSRYLGYEREELIGRKVHTLFRPLGDEDPEAFFRFLKEADRGEVHRPAIFRRKGGGEIVLNGTKAPSDPDTRPRFATKWYPIECLVNSHREIEARLKKEDYIKSMMRYHAFLSQEALRSETCETFLQEALNALAKTVDPSLGGFLLLGRGELRFTHASTPFEERLSPLFPPLAPKKGKEKGFLPCFLAATHRKMVFVDDVGLLPDSPVREALLELGVRTLAAIPIEASTKETKGVFTLLFGERHKFDKEELELWQSVANALGFGLASIRLRTERDELIRKLDAMAHTDNLTGVVNRHRGVELVRHEIRRSGRYGKRFSVIFFDIDNFKTINDTYGHQMGDRILVEVAKTVGASLRSTDALIRWGGEEFLILLPETGLGDAVHLATKLRERIERRDGSMPLAVTASFGVAEWNGDETLDSLVSRVDAKMYEAKREGRNRIAY